MLIPSMESLNPSRRTALAEQVLAAVNGNGASHFLRRLPPSLPQPDNPPAQAFLPPHLPLQLVIRSPVAPCAHPFPERGVSSVTLPLRPLLPVGVGEGEGVPRPQLCQLLWGLGQPLLPPARCPVAWLGLQPHLPQ